jgi:hypothetical protein
MSSIILTTPRLKSKSSTIRRKNLVLDIKQNGTEMAPCNGCRIAKVSAGEARLKCVVSPRSSKCSECIKHNRTSYDASLSFP